MYKRISLIICLYCKLGPTKLEYTAECETNYKMGIRNYIIIELYWNWTGVNRRGRQKTKHFEVRSSESNKWYEY